MEVGHDSFTNKMRLALPKRKVLGLSDNPKKAVNGNFHCWGGVWEENEP